MSDIAMIGFYLAKVVFKVYWADGCGRVVLRKKLRRDQVLAFSSTIAPCTVAMEACGGPHFWGRAIARLGHEVRLIPAGYVKPFVKRQKNDGEEDRGCSAAA